MRVEAARAARERAWPSVGPRWRMPSPTSTRGEAARASTPRWRRRAVLGRLLRHALERHELLDGERVDVAGVGEQPGVDELAHALLAEALDVHRAAAGEVHDALRRAARDTRGSRSDGRTRPRAARAARRTRGRPSGTSSLRARFGRFASTGPTTSGITSPALRTMTVSPGRTSLRATSSWLCSVASPTVEPPTNTGSSSRERRRPTGAPDAHHDVDAGAWSSLPAGTCTRSPSAAPCW